MLCNVFELVYKVVVVCLGIVYDIWRDSLTGVVLYRITYDDEDSEDVELEELEQILCWRVPKKDQMGEKHSNLFNVATRLHNASYPRQNLLESVSQENNEEREEFCDNTFRQVIS